MCIRYNENKTRHIENSVQDHLFIMKTKATPQKSPLGTAYETAQRQQKMRFSAELIEAQFSDGVNYLKRFQQTWQYKSNTGETPYKIVVAAIKHLGFTPNL